MISGDWTLAVSCTFDGLLLWMTARFLPKRLPFGRYVLAIGTATLPTVWVLIRQQIYSGPWMLGLMLLWPLLVLYAGFGWLSRSEWIRGAALFYGTTMLAGGLVLAMRTALSGVVDGLSPMWALPPSLAVLVVLGWRGPRWWRRSQHDQLKISEMQMHFAGQVVRLSVLWDSGNELRDPVWHRPVVIVELPAVWSWLPEEVLAWALTVFGGDPGPVPEQWAGRLGLARFHSVGGEGQIPVVRADHIAVWGPEVGWESLEPVMVGIVAAPLTSTGRYQALASPECYHQRDDEGVMGA